MPNAKKHDAIRDVNAAIEAMMKPLREARTVIMDWPETKRWLLDFSPTGRTGKELQKMELFERMVREGFSAPNAHVILDTWERDMWAEQFLIPRRNRDGRRPKRGDDTLGRD